MTRENMVRHLLAAACLLWAAASSQAAHLLTVDISNPAAVVIAGTGEFPIANYDAVTTVLRPIRLDDFFTALANADNPTYSDVGSTLETFNGAGPLNSAMVRAAGDGQRLILRIFPSSAEDFSTASPAFVGQAVFDMTGNGGVDAPDVSGFFRTMGHTGNVLAADGTVVGTYILAAVPEPSAVGVAGGLACLALAAWRRRKAGQPVVGP
jgi:hypothetical protein